MLFPYKRTTITLYVKTMRQKLKCVTKNKHDEPCNWYDSEK